jgi:serine/threonine protein kinase/Tol biopolymer transport system component
MKCPKCQSNNPDTSRFCGNCATQLMRTGQPVPELTKTLESPSYSLTRGSLVVGKYRIIDEIGRGGMGVVYDAEDTTLTRRVAIKVLPEIFTGDPERMARFEREAKLLASVNHPNIAAIHGLEESEGKRFLVMELVDGETLAARISRGPLNLEEVRKVGLQIADGVGAAHDRGIIHRDLKPANVKLTPEGRVKVLDFGLAKAFGIEAAGADLEKSPTITEKMTAPGVILGTAAYMSPEQAKGKPVDKRTDIWALGCILYECLTGQRAFRGETVTETLAAILKGEPDWSALPPDTPPSVRRLLIHCLSRDQSRRLSDIHDAGLEIEELGAALAPSLPGGKPGGLGTRWRLLGAGVAVIGLAVLGSFLIRLNRTPSERDLPVIRVSLPGEFTSSRPIYPSLNISPDGSKIIFVGDRNGQRYLFLRARDRWESSLLDGTEGANGPFVSPDGTRIGFFSAGKMQSVAVTGGAPTDICGAAGGPSCASWGEDGTIVFTPRWGSGLYCVSAKGGIPVPLTTLDEANREVTHLWPQILPGGKAVLFTALPGDVMSGDDSHIDLQVQGEKRHRVLLRGGSCGRYVSPGYLVYQRKGALLAVRFDLNSLEVRGTPVAVVDGVQSTAWTGIAHFAVSNTGTLVYASGRVYPPEDSLVQVDLTGHVTPLVMEKNISTPCCSPDGRIAMRIAAANDDVWMYAPERKQLTRVTFELGDELKPVWTPDGKSLIYSWGRTKLCRISVDGTGEPALLYSSDHEVFPESVSPDGHMLAFRELMSDGGLDVWFLPLQGESKPQKVLSTSFRERSAAFSPNGRWLAYASDESGRLQVYLRQVGGAEGKRQVSASGGDLPVWSHSGDKLFFLDGRRIMAAKVEPGSGLVSSIEFLFELGSLVEGESFDLGPDDKSLVMVISNNVPAETDLRIVNNWNQELKRLVPTGKK